MSESTDLISLDQAAKQYPFSRTTLWRLAEGGELRTARQVKKKSRTVWMVERGELEQRLPAEAVGHPAAPWIKKWEQEQATGYHSGRVISPRRIKENTYGLRVFWKYHTGAAEVDEVKLEHIRLEAFTAQALKNALAAVPVDYETKRDGHATKETMYFSVTSFAQLLIREGLLGRVELADMRKERPKKRVFEPRRTVLQDNQLEELLAVNEGWTAGRSPHTRALTHTLVCLFAYAGLRRAEAVNLLMEHVDMANRMLHVVDGKCHKHREVGMCPELHAQLDTWITHYRGEPGVPHLLVQESGRPVTLEVANHRIQTLGKKAGKAITPHGLRRTFATRVEARGMPLTWIQHSLGHVNIKTTRQYVMSEQRHAVDWLRQMGQPQAPPMAPEASAVEAEATAQALAKLLLKKLSKK